MSTKVDIVKSDGSVISNIQGQKTKLQAGKYTLKGIKSSLGIGYTNTKGNWIWIDPPVESEFNFGPVDLQSGSYYVHNMGLELDVSSATPPVPPVTPPVTPPIPPTPTNTIKVTAPYAHHVSVDGPTPKTWTNGTRGYNTGDIFLTPGTYAYEGTTIEVSGGLTVQNATSTILPSVIQSGTCLQLKEGTTYTLTNSNIQMMPNSMICTEGWQNGKKAKIVASYGTSFLIDASNQTIIAGITFDSVETGPEKSGPDCILPNINARVSVLNCQFLNVNYAVNGNRNPNGVIVDNCTAPLISGIKSYFCWVQGSNWVIRNCSINNSTREHCIRVSGADKIQVYNCSLINVASDVSNIPNDVAKGTLVLQLVTRAYAYNLVITGPCGTGPLGAYLNDQSKKERTAHIVIEDSTIIGHVEVHHGASDVTLRRLKITSADPMAFDIEGYNDGFQRGVDNVTVANCEVDGRYFGVMNPSSMLNDQTPTGFAQIGNGATNITLKDNTLVSKYMRVGGWGGPSVVSVGKNVANFKSINNNWPIASFRVGDTKTSTYVDVATWNKFGGDKIEKLI